jgi:hypothetical protein
MGSIETPAAFTRRTSIAYAPPPRVTALARPLGHDEPCPPLHRYPGPCGLAAWFAGRLERLAPDDADVLWMSSRPVIEDSIGARHFGTLLVERPLAFAAGLVTPGIYLGVNRRLRPDDQVTWLAPSGGSRAQVIDRLCRYLEEIDAMRRSGAPGPGIPWCAVPAAARRRLLAAQGVAGVWTESESSLDSPCYTVAP